MKNGSVFLLVFKVHAEPFDAWRPSFLFSTASRVSRRASAAGCSRTRKAFVNAGLPRMLCHLLNGLPVRSFWQAVSSRSPGLAHVFAEPGPA